MKPLYTWRCRTRGFSMVELMVALTIGLIILAAVSSLFVSSKQTYTTQDSLARLQENARFAMQFLISDLRLAGHFGCLDDIDPGPPLTTNPDGSTETSNLKITLTGGTAFATNAFIPVEGAENATGTWLPSGAALPAGLKTGTDALTVRLADNSAAANVAPGMLNGSADLVVNNIPPHPFVINNIIVVSDCATADIMQITGITGNVLQHTAGVGVPGNATQKLSKAYAPPARVFRLATRSYYIANGASGQPALFRSGAELVEGIENLQVLYGEYTVNPPNPNKAQWVPSIYRKATAVSDWTKVVSVRIGILARTLNDKNTDIDATSYDVDGDGSIDFTPPSSPPDRYRRRAFQATVQLRNML